ncbi:MAG: aspartyl protease family protein [Chloroflexi bacterium]|nr:aspartyl protease family protein [Chloroflexota bacterium]
MGVTFVRGTVRNDGQSATMDFLVDSGAEYTLLPYETWQQLGLEPVDRHTFVLADGTQVERGLAECRFQMDQGATNTWVILGEPGDDPLLGVYTLEGLRSSSTRSTAPFDQRACP